MYGDAKLQKSQMLTTCFDPQGLLRVIFVIFLRVIFIFVTLYSLFKKKIDSFDQFWLQLTFAYIRDEQPAART